MIDSGMDKISMIVPCERDRIPLFRQTLDRYFEFGFSGVELIVVSRTIEDMVEVGPYPLRLFKYKWEHRFFCEARAINIGIKNATYDNLLITAPEVRPRTDVIGQLRALPRGNYICQVFDLNEDGSVRISLVNSQFRAYHPGYYFLALYRKEDVELVNGLDEDFMAGNALNDIDFGERLVRAGVRYEMRDEIQAEHQFHKRCLYQPRGMKLNQKILERNRRDRIVRAKNGIEKFGDWQEQFSSLLALAWKDITFM